MTSWS